MRAKLVKEGLNDLLVPKSKEDIIKELSKLTQKEKNYKLFDASANGQLDIVKMLIEAGADVNDSDIGIFTPLIYASKYGHLDIVEFLIKVGADINAKNKWGETAFELAYENGYFYIVNLLKKHGAN